MAYIFVFIPILMVWASGNDCKTSYERHLKFEKEELEGPDRNPQAFELADPAIEKINLSKIEKAILYENLLKHNSRRLDAIAKDHKITYMKIERIRNNLIKKIRSFFVSIGMG